MQRKQESKKSISPQGQVDKEELVAVGKLHRTFGVKGDIRFELFPPKMKLPDIFYLQTKDGVFIPVEVENISIKKGLVRFKGYNTKEKAREITNRFLFTHKSHLPPLEKNQYYVYQLVGLDVYQGDTHLGKVIQVDDRLPDVLLVIESPEKKTLHIPFINEFVKDVDLEKKRIELSLPEGWEEL
ncbi:MAG: 16S rRNA processing protein RimM [Aquificae bacterium]|nr:16S rRNA processing protein RimM [Aquificota bacterium]